MKTVAIIQARMGSTRLPGKVMLSLDCTPTIRHVTRRAQACERVDEVVVATTEKRRDDLVAKYASCEGASIARGDEADVLDRVFQAARVHDADVVVRLTADNPLTPPDVTDAAIQKLREGGHDYVSNKLDRTFPAGFDTEVFTFDSFESVEHRATDEYDREHVTPLYRRSGEFDAATITSQAVYNDPSLHDRTELRLTLDTPADFELFTRLYENVPYDDILDTRDAVRYVDEQGLETLNVA